MVSLSVKVGIAATLFLLSTAALVYTIVALWHLAINCNLLYLLFVILAFGLVLIWLAVYWHITKEYARILPSIRAKAAEQVEAVSEALLHDAPDDRYDAPAIPISESKSGLLGPSPSGRRLSPTINDAVPADGAAPVDASGAPAAAAAVAKPPFMMRCMVVTMYLLAILLLATVFGFFGTVVYFQAHTLPRHTGTINLPGLSQPVTITRDSAGVVHIDAASEADAFFAQGVVNAQDRMWQIEFQRRVGKGTLSAAVGDGALSTDKFARVMNFYAHAVTSYDNLSPETQVAIDSFCAGINAYLDTNPPLSIEFFLLGLGTPAHFNYADVLVWSKMMSYMLSLNMDKELQRWSWFANNNVSLPRIAEFMPPYDTTHFPYVLEDEDLPADLRLTPQQAVAAEAARNYAANLKNEPGADWLHARRGDWTSAAQAQSVDVLRSHIGAIRDMLGYSRASNNWVVSGSRTESRHPILCNDPHLQLLAPSIWLLIHLRAPGLNVIGASFAGAPGVVLGRNDRISWGVTNTGADVQDLFIMDEQPNNHTHYQYKGEWLEYEMRDEIIHVKGGSDVILPVRETLYGPVVTDIDLDWGNLANPPLSLRWTSLQQNDTTFQAFYRLGKCNNYTEFREALSHFVAPSQNFIYADVDGNIGYQLPGKIPIRVAGHSGLMPIPGNGTFDWIDYIPYEELPRAWNPTKGYIASANNRATPPSYKHHIAHDWDGGSSGYRAKRITDFILEHSTGGEEDPVWVKRIDMQVLQQDTLSLIAKDFVPQVLLRLPSDRLSEKAAQWQAQLATWDYDTVTGSINATVFQRWFIELTTITDDETNSTRWHNPLYFLNLFANSNFSGEAPADGVAWSGESRDPLCHTSDASSPRSCVAYAIAKWEKVINMPSTQSTYCRWGQDTHQAKFQHAVLTKSPVACIADRSVAHGGDGDTVNVGPYDDKTFVQTAGPSYRQVIDWSDVEMNSLFLNPLGQSGNIFSSNYDDLMSKWSKGDYLSMRTTGYSGDELKIQA